jgi:hypothetical protein
MKIRSALCLFVTFYLLVLSGCFQPVDLGETIVDKGAARLRISNAAADEFYILEGFELRNAEGAAVWENLNLSGGQSCEVNTNLAGTFTVLYKVRDTWFSTVEVKDYNAGEKEIALNRFNDFPFDPKEFAPPEDSDGDGYPDVWEDENGFDKNNSADGGPVYVSRTSGQDDGDGTRSYPYLTLAKAVNKAGRGLRPAIRTVVVLDQLDPGSGNDQNPAYPGRADSVFYLGKTRNPITIQPEDPETIASPGVLTAVASGKRVLYLDTGANIILKNIKITGGKGSGGGIYASGATLTLGNGATVTENNYPLPADLTGINGGGISMERGVLVMEPGSSVNGNNAFTGGGVRVAFSTFTMEDAVINNNYASGGAGGLTVGGSTVKMLSGAEIRCNTVGKTTDTTTRGRTSGGATITTSTVFTMYPGSSIHHNTVNNGFGGGVNVGGESFLYIKGGDISHNTCSGGGEGSGVGGGVYAAYQGSVIMESGSIADNTAKKATTGAYTDKSGWGGGVFLHGDASFTMTYGEVKNNTAEAKGGGVYLQTSGAVFKMTGGTVYGNNSSGDKNVAGTTTDSDTGHAVYVAIAIPYSRDDNVYIFPPVSGSSPSP